MRRPAPRYTLLLRDGGGDTASVVGSLAGFAHVPDDDGRAALAALAVDARVKVLSLTVTEKGYCRDAVGVTHRLSRGSTYCELFLIGVNSRIVVVILVACLSLN